MNGSTQHRKMLGQHTPHELALTALGLSLQLGVQPLRREQVLHVVQEHGGCDSRCRASLPAVSSEVTLIACLQDSTHSNGVPAASSALDNLDAGHHIVWAMPAAELLRELQRIDPGLTTLLLEPHYAVASEPERRVEAIRVTKHRGRPRAWDSSGKPRAYDSRDRTASQRFRFAGHPADLQLAAAASSEPSSSLHAEALALLQRVVLEAAADDGGGSDRQQWPHAQEPVRWRRVELQQGDILVADDSVLLCHTNPSVPHGTARVNHSGDNIANRPQASAVGDAVASSVEIYDELEVLMSCNESRKRRRSSHPLEQRPPHRRRSHALWVGMRRERAPLRWWWW
jgi:hypothetical protein